MNDPLGSTKNPFIFTHGVNPVTGGLQIMITAEFSLRDQMRVDSVEHLIAHLLGALDDVAEMWKKETA